MPDKPWKAFERQIAKALGTRRALQKGTKTKEDVEHPILMLDAKLRTNWSVVKWFTSLRKAARSKYKIPALVLRQPGKKITYAVIEFDTFRSLLKVAGWVYEGDMDYDDWMEETRKAFERTQRNFKGVLNEIQGGEFNG